MPSHSSGPIGTRGSISRARQGWRGWRLSRPFWGGLVVMAAGAEVLAIRLSIVAPYPPDKAEVIPVGILIGIALVLCGLLLWFHPVQRSVYSTTAILLAILALMTAHLGGYLLGSLLGAVGGAVAFAWVPAAQKELRSRHGKPARVQAQGPALTLIIGAADSGPVPPEVSWRGEDAGTATSSRPPAAGSIPDLAARRSSADSAGRWPFS